ncbi:MAG: cysteine--tRNA ligase [Bacteroidia bacterium]|nr:cysteine--tRNA ligase [Bacteroidia bacterium]MDW8301787.1 cysteine--tRNA ligase [Bacteroidia bacterium]
MSSTLQIYNTYTRKKEIFEPLVPGFVGMYVCGPTVYGDTHLGHLRSAITFDIVYRYFLHKGYKVRYVKNITDVGHLTDELNDAGEDKLQKKARLEQLEPMEIAQKYTYQYERIMDIMNVLPPSIAPRATGHIIEQIEFIQKIIDAGFAYVVNGSVYFDVVKYAKEGKYGILSGRKLEELLAGAGEERRELKEQQEKRNPADFALWKKAPPEHIMKWNSPWGVGFPGWHIECSAMSSKYLGNTFDIHGGGMDLIFPHHEAEIAQSHAGHQCIPARYWMHNNMLTINGQKMAKSLGNFITVDEFLTGKHLLLEKAYSPMTMRFFMLQAHYRSTLDFSNEALQAAEKGLQRLLEGYQFFMNLTPSESNNSVSFEEIQQLQQKCYQAIEDDFNTPVLIAHLYSGLEFKTAITHHNKTINAQSLSLLQNIYKIFVVDILGIKVEEKTTTNQTELLHQLIDEILKLRYEIRLQKNFAKADEIRNRLSELGIEVKDTKEGSTWKWKQ